MSSNDSGPPKRKKGPPGDQHLMMAFLGVGLSISVEIAISTTAGWYLGNWVDKKMGWQPWGMLAGVVIFLTVSMIHAIIVLTHLNNRMNGEE